MARKRMIDPKIWETCYDKNFSTNDFTVLIAAISSADDEGRGKISMIERAVGKMLKEKEFLKSLKSLSDTIVIYDNIYYYLTNWCTYQKIDRPTPSKIPVPTNGKSVNTHGLIDEGSTNAHGLITDESLTSHENSSAIRSRSRIESEAEVEKEVKEKEPPPQQQTTKLFAIWGRNPDNGERSKTDNLLKQFGWKLVWDAFHRASEMGKEKKNVAYVRGILTSQDKSVNKFSRGIGAG